MTRGTIKDLVRSCRIRKKVKYVAKRKAKKDAKALRKLKKKALRFLTNLADKDDEWQNFLQLILDFETYDEMKEYFEFMEKCELRRRAYAAFSDDLMDKV